MVKLATRPEGTWTTFETNAVWTAAAESVTVSKQDRKAFTEALGNALAVDPEKVARPKRFNLCVSDVGGYREGRTADLRSDAAGAQRPSPPPRWRRSRAGAGPAMSESSRTSSSGSS